MKRSATRRSFLKAVGAGATALPFYRMLEDSAAKAAGEPLPLRFITVYHPHGIAAELFVMRSGDTETNFDISYSANGAQCALQPFDDAATYGKSFKNLILPIEGIDLLSNANGHASAGTILTGSQIEGDKPKNSSLDQYLAVERRLGAATRVTSLALGVGTDATDSGSTLSFGPGGAPLPKIIDPQVAWDLLFKGYVATNDPAMQAAEMRRRAQGRSVIDFIKGDVDRLYPKLAAREQQKLDQHLDSLRDMEKQFADAMPGVMGPMCNPPSRPMNPPALKRYNGGEPHFDTITNMFIDLIAQAFACDITRFVTFYMADLSYANNPLGLPEDNHGAVAHTYNGSEIGSDGRPTGPGVASTWVPLAKFNRYAYGKIARLMQRLDQAGVLENTLIYASSDMGNPALHSTRNVPTVLAGGANGKFRMGRRLKMQPDCMTNPWCAPGDNEFKGATNNKLLISIAHAFGITDLTTFGTQPNAAWKTGTLSGLT